MADRDLDAELAQALGVGVLDQVRALHAMAEVVQDLGDAAHADAADADEMNAARVDRQNPHASASRWRLATEGESSEMVASASACPASGRPCAWALRAI